MKEEEILRFGQEILSNAYDLEQRLPQIYMRMPISEFTGQGDNIWLHIKQEIIKQYPQHEALLSRDDLAFRVVYRPADPNETLPGFDDTSENTRTLFFRYGLDYQPKIGEYIGMIREKPWTYYLLPDTRNTNPLKYHSMIYVYDNANDQLVSRGQTTVGPIPQDNFLSDYIRMKIEIIWVDVDADDSFDPVVHDDSVDSLGNFMKRLGIDMDEV